MKFVMVPRGRNSTVPKDLPCVILKQDIWDDVGFKTMFDARLFLEHEGSVDLGPVKIMKRGQESGFTQIPDQFDKLDDSYCSVGQAYSYYEILHSLPDSIQRGVLSGIRDLAAHPQIRESFADEPALDSSLLRYGNAELALRDGTALLSGTTRRTRGIRTFIFETSVGGNHFEASFAFQDRTPLPGRMNVVVGYNGCGKTQLLANLANAAHADLTLRNLPEFRQKYGRFRGNATEERFSSIIAISYSAFDTFDLPGKSPEELERLKAHGDVSGYVYCGLRRHAREVADTGSAPIGALKGADEIRTEILSALDRARSGERMARLVETLVPLNEEPSFRRMELGDQFAHSNSGWENDFAALSTGHKLVLNIAVQLVAYLEPGSLVLIDEPESHLHPPLLAALTRSINIALEAFDSYAVVATHSPVLLQEVPRRYVHVLQRFGDTTRVTSPEIETFGESVGLLTRHVFNLDNSATDYHETLRQMGERFSFDEVSELFDGELSAQSLAYLAGIPRNQPGR
ncbi:AAA family ATPase [Streptomyces microflavus]|uniref:AAA family ATPase n=1 Tax=Streptomyces microflavus TaxID=1919 RepID=UPI003452AA19